MSKTTKIKDNHVLNSIMDLYHHHNLCYEEVEELSELTIEQQSKWLVMYMRMHYLEKQVEHYENKINQLKKFVGEI